MHSSGTASPSSPKRIASLDGLRAVSIALVMVSHLAGTRRFPISRDQLENTVGELGNAGVRVFFVISGFLITSLLLGEIRKTGRISLGGFYRRRLIRIFPAAYAFVAAVFVLDRAGFIQLCPGDIGAALTYTMNFHHPQSQWLVHLWSLSIEEQFYMSWPAIMLLLGVRGSGWVAAAQVALAPVLRVIIWFRFPQYRHFQQFETAMDPIALGCLLALCRSWLHDQPSYIRILRSSWFLLIPAGTLLMLVMAAHSFSAYMARDSVMNVGIALCIDQVVTYPDTRVGRFLNHRHVAYVGTLSYSLYLWQQLFMERDSVAFVQQFPLNIVLAVGAGVTSFYLIERPILRWRARTARPASA